MPGAQSYDRMRAAPLCVYTVEHEEERYAFGGAVFFRFGTESRLILEFALRRSTRRTTSQASPRVVLSW